MTALAFSVRGDVDTDHCDLRHWPSVQLNTTRICSLATAVYQT